MMDWAVVVRASSRQGIRMLSTRGMILSYEWER
jgi:hypothetical protein